MSLDVNDLTCGQKTLFISYDGLLDPLGASQILPYLYGIADHPRHLHIISFEKPARYCEGGELLRQELAERGVVWTPLSFTSRLGKVGKAWDLLKMYGAAFLLQLKHRFGIAHCRSYQAMQVGCFIKRFTGVKIIFDMRGLWVDDRIDRCIWPQNKLPYRLLYRHYKKVERRLLECADSVVVLTDRVVPEIKNISPHIQAPLAVIPCCADFDHFKSIPELERRIIRSELNIDPDALVLSYLGSLGTVYLLDDMLHLFETLARDRNDVHLLLITKDWTDAHASKLTKLGLMDLRDRIHVKSASRNEVPKLLGASDAMLNFISPTYSMQACSPTKMAESLAMGIPVISRAGVGDVDAITQDLNAGAIIDLDDPSAIERVSSELDVILAKGGEHLRLAARDRLGLEKAKRAYREVYDELEDRV
ncbi:glycosyltransferase [Halomonas sp. RA08-2]|uniref:glycosyltransferase n=1 Tax=Halomonas sp. RA08-2 TaxID=3440842 RepID=UPI003EE9C785